MLTRAKTSAAWVAILAITAGFQFFRGASIDGTVFTVAAIALIVDIIGLPARFAFRPPRVRKGVVVGACALTAAALVLLPRYSVADAVIVVAVGLAVVPFMWAIPSGRGEDAPGRLDDARSERETGRLERHAKDAADPEAARRAVRHAALLWAALGIALCLWEMTAFFLGMPSPRAEWAHPPLSDLIGPMLSNPIGRAVCVVLWLGGGVALLRRGRPQ